MKYFKTWFCLFLISSISLTSSGCATYRTINDAQINSPKIFSGTRLNLHAINKNHVALKKFKVEPPKYPLLDLPGSFVLDIVISPLTMGLTAYEAIFY